MLQRGRKSAASQAVAVLPASTVRLKAPAHISDAELAVWTDLVNDQPAEAFTVTHVPMLELYCRHIVQARIVADELLNFDRAWMASDEGLKRYDRLLTMAERESRAASSLATRLRITRHAVDHPSTVGRAVARQQSKTRKPWELPG